MRNTGFRVGVAVWEGGDGLHGRGIEGGWNKGLQRELRYSATLCALLVLELFHKTN